MTEMELREEIRRYEPFNEQEREDKKEILRQMEQADHIRKKIAWIPQELALPSEWVSEMVRMPFELKANREAGFNKERLMDYFVSLGLEEKLYDKRVNEVSCCQQCAVHLYCPFT